MTIYPCAGFPNTIHHLNIHLRASGCTSSMVSWCTRERSAGGSSHRSCSWSDDDRCGWPFLAGRNQEVSCPVLRQLSPSSTMMWSDMTSPGLGLVSGQFKWIKQDQCGTIKYSSYTFISAVLLALDQFAQIFARNIWLVLTITNISIVKPKVQIQNLKSWNPSIWILIDNKIKGGHPPSPPSFHNS